MDTFKVHLFCFSRKMCISIQSHLKSNTSYQITISRKMEIYAVKISPTVSYGRGSEILLHTIILKFSGHKWIILLFLKILQKLIPRKENVISPEKVWITPMLRNF